MIVHHYSAIAKALNDTGAFNEVALFADQPQRGQVVDTPAALVAFGEVSLEARGRGATPDTHSFEGDFTLRIYTDNGGEQTKISADDNPLFALERSALEALRDYELKGYLPPAFDNGLLTSAIIYRYYGTGNIVPVSGATKKIEKVEITPSIKKEATT